jgi:hypothetical protein
MAAICLAGFRVPQESRPVKAPIHSNSFYQGWLLVIELFRQQLSDFK